MRGVALCFNVEIDMVEELMLRTACRVAPMDFLGARSETIRALSKRGVCVPDALSLLAGWCIAKAPNN